MGKIIKNKCLFAGNLCLVLIQKKEIMRPIHRIFVALALACSSFTAKSQVNLGIDTIFNLPDSVIAGQLCFPTAIVRNSGLTPFNGTLQLAYQVQNPAGTIGFFYFSNQPVQLGANDTISLSPNNGFVIDTMFFRPGNNVVVVWPVVQAIASIDTFTTQVYLNTLSGVSDLSAETLLLSPVPARDYLQVRSINEMQIEYVRIYDVAGREYPAESQPLDRGGREIYLGELPSGQFILETVFRNGPPSRSRFLRLK
jgi:hypothetical protein